MKACPLKAISRRSDGIIVIDQTICAGCGECRRFCPYQAPQLNVAERKMQKCFMCTDRIEKGLQPACATLCPTGALKWGEWDTIKSQGTDRVPSFTGPDLTKPRVRFVTKGWGE